MTNTKRLGRYHNPYTSNNDNNSTPISYFNKISSSLYEDIGWKRSIDFDKPLFGYRRSSLQKVLANANKTIEKSTKFMNKIKSRRLAYANRARSIPENATIRKEYIKCGKQICEQRHGPYYYAYWKDSENKLKKKYIGNHMPKNQQLKDNCKQNQIL